MISVYLYIRIFKNPLGPHLTRLFNKYKGTLDWKLADLGFCPDFNSYNHRNLWFFHLQNEGALRTLAVSKLMMDFEKNRLFSVFLGILESKALGGVVLGQMGLLNPPFPYSFISSHYHFKTPRGEKIWNKTSNANIK